MKQQTVGKPSGVVTLKYTAKELDLLRGVFKDNEPLLKVIRKSLLQHTLTEQEDHILVQNIKGDDLKVLMHRIFLPCLTDDNPITHEYDEWSGDQLEMRLVENAVQVLRARKLAMEYGEQEFNNLFERKESEIKLKDLESLINKTDVEIFINFLARQAIVNKVKDFVRDLKVFGNTEKMTDEELSDMIRKNSTK